MFVCHNPYCSGQWSRTHHKKFRSRVPQVLILIVVDNGLVPFRLVLSGDGLLSLNPCCSGQWSRTLNNGTQYHPSGVLILIVMDNGLVLDLIKHY